MSLEAKALDLVSNTLWNELIRLRGQAVSMLQGDQMRLTADLHNLVDGIAAHIAALDVLHETAQPAVKVSLPDPVPPASVVPGPGDPLHPPTVPGSITAKAVAAVESALGLAKPPSDFGISSVNHGLNNV